MRIFSQNLTNYDIPLPDNSIFRINLAWINSLDELNSLLKKHSHSEIFMDLPIGRTKPPNNKYSIDELKPILKKFSNIAYLAISNVDSEADLQPFLDLLVYDIIIVPKIESPVGVKNIEKISKLLGDKKIVMLDHDDLYSSIIRSNDDADNFQIYVKTLVDFCDKNKIILLRTIGVIFGDTEKRISEYVK